MPPGIAVSAAGSCYVEDDIWCFAVRAPALPSYDGRSERNKWWTKTANAVSRAGGENRSAECSAFGMKHLV